MTTFCQFTIIALLLFGFTVNLWRDFNGTKAREPGGFGGAVVTIIVTLLVALCYWKAGAFSTILPL